MADLDPRSLPGLAWHENGQCTLSGELLELESRLEGLFARWARRFDAAEHRFPTFLAARELAKLDYFRSFPHLVTFPVSLDPAEQNLKRFVASQPVDAGGTVALTATGPVRDVLTPAACYHCYVHFQGRELTTPLFLTTRNTCFRREQAYRPLERQWSFSMREIVCIGTDLEVRDFLARAAALVDELLAAIGLDGAWQVASDPFYDPARNPKALLQKLHPVKRELLFGSGLAIGSTNHHFDTFGTAFGISRDGEAASSGCIAFGIERWILALLQRFGADPSGWPDLGGAA